MIVNFQLSRRYDPKADDGVELELKTESPITRWTLVRVALRLMFTPLRLREGMYE